MPTVSQRFVSHRAGAASGRALDPSAPVVLMVSGGADSTALLVMACTSKLDIMDGRGPARIARERIHVLHVNHHLRGEASDADEEHVRGLCERYGVPLCVEHASFTELNGQNLEAAAREVRYAAARRYVRELCQEAGCPRTAARIVTAHTASDRAETFFMNAIKGAGPAGLSSIPRRRNIIVRPLIDLTHEELCRYLEVAGIAWREDESNQDTSYLRNFVRHRVIPVARERNESLARNVGAACDILGDEDAFMAHLAATALRSCTRRQQEGLVVLDAARVAAAEVAIARRMVRLAVKQLDAEARLEMRHVESILRCVAAGEGSLTLPGNIDARIEFGTLALRTASAREHLVAGWIAVPGRMPLANGFPPEPTPLPSRARRRPRQLVVPWPMLMRRRWATLSAIWCDSRNREAPFRRSPSARASGSMPPHLAIFSARWACMAAARSCLTSWVRSRFPWRSARSCRSCARLRGAPLCGLAEFASMTALSARPPVKCW